MSRYTVSHEWVVEQMEDDEIVDTSSFESLTEAQAWAEGTPGCVISLRRIEGDDLDGEVDRQTAYPGSTCYDGGAVIPRRLLAQLKKLG